METIEQLADEVREHLPMRPPVLHLLLALSSGPAHGYALKQEVERRAGGLIRMGPGTLYESIQRMERRGLIEEVTREGDAGSRRRTYSITALGRAALKGELERLDEVVRHARSLRLLPATA